MKTPKPEISRFGLVAKPQSPYSPSAIKLALDWGKKNGIDILLDADSAYLVNEKGLERKKLLEAVDVLIVLGGDGSFLAAARMATDYSVPLLGVNLGKLGFITEVSLDEFEIVLDYLKAGNFTIQNRMMLEVKVSRQNETRTATALNDIVITHRNLARMIEMGITIGDQSVTQYKADGLIVSTPTGSTAYALSAGGPILYPTLDSVLICPICPHTLTNRPLVIPADATINVDVHTQNEVIATLDGQVLIEIDQNDDISIYKSKKIVKIIKLPGRTHFDTLRNKLGWGGSQASSL
jgi:NAD+ kinase